MKRQLLFIIIQKNPWANITTLLNSAAKAVRELSAEYDKDIQIVLHFTNPEKGYGSGDFLCLYLCRWRWASEYRL